MILKWILLVPVILHAQSPGSLFREAGPLAAAARDVRANAPGDIVTIVRVRPSLRVGHRWHEHSEAIHRQRRRYPHWRARWPPETPLGSLLDFSNERKLQGQGETTRAMALTTTISARVVARPRTACSLSKGQSKQ